MIFCLRLLDGSVPVFHRGFQHNNEAQPQQASGDQQHRKPPVHADQEDRRAKKADCHTHQIRQNLQHSILDHLNIREHSADHLTAVKKRQIGILLFQQLLQYHRAQAFLHHGVRPDGQNAEPQRQAPYAQHRQNQHRGAPSQPYAVPGGCPVDQSLGSQRDQQGAAGQQTFQDTNCKNRKPARL